jgi:negative regulator of the PHO system
MDYKMAAIGPKSKIGDYVIEDKIDEGAFCEVWKGKKSGQKVAIKVYDGCSRRSMRDYYNEIKILSALKDKSKNIMKIYDYFGHLAINIPYDLGAQGSAKMHAIMIVELLGDSLGDLLDIYDQGLPLDVVKKIMRQILMGVAVCHDNKIFHADLKCRNILLRGSLEAVEEGKCDIVIIDFNSSVYLKADIGEFKGPIGTQEYAAPEIILSMNYNLKADIWSCGCIFYQLLTGNHLFEFEDDSSSARVSTGGTSEAEMSTSGHDEASIVTTLVIQAVILGLIGILIINIYS